MEEGPLSDSVIDLYLRDEPIIEYYQSDPSLSGVGVSLQSLDRAAVFALALFAVFFGYNWVVMKSAVQYASPFDFAALRTFLGALSLFITLLVLRRPIWPPVFSSLILLGILQTTGNLGMATWALESGGAGKTAVLVYIMPFWTLLFAFLFLGEKLGRRQILGSGIALLGLGFVLVPLQMGEGLFSQMLALGSGFSWAASTITLKKIRQAHPQIDLLTVTAWQMVIGSLPLSLIALLDTQQPILWTPTFVGALIYNILPATAIAFALWYFALSRLPAGIASLGTLVNPVIGVLAAWLQLGERPSLTEGIGIGLILSALVVINLPPQRSPERETPGAQTRGCR